MMSRKLSFSPRLHFRLLFLQFMQSGVDSSHFKCRSLHVKQPVRTLRDLSLGLVGASTGLGRSIVVDMVVDTFIRGAFGSLLIATDI